MINLIQFIKLDWLGGKMESTEKDILIEKIANMPPEQVSKVLIFIAGLEAGNKIIKVEAKENA